MFTETANDVKWFRLHAWIIESDVPVSEMELTHTNLDHLIEEVYRFAEINKVYMNSVLVGSSVQTRVDGKFGKVMYYTLTPVPSSAPEAPYRTSLPKTRCQGGNAVTGM